MKTIMGLKYDEWIEHAARMNEVIEGIDIGSMSSKKHMIKYVGLLDATNGKVKQYKMANTIQLIHLESIYSSLRKQIFPGKNDSEREVNFLKACRMFSLSKEQVKMIFMVDKIEPVVVDLIEILTKLRIKHKLLESVDSMISHKMQSFNLLNSIMPDEQERIDINAM